MSLLDFAFILFALAMLLAVISNVTWLIKKVFFQPKTSEVAKTLDLAMKQMSRYDPTPVLTRLLESHPQVFSQIKFKKILADCSPYDEEVFYQDCVPSLYYFWIVELFQSHSQENNERFAYIVGWFDSRLISHLQAWFFPTSEEALACAITSLEIGKGQTEPNQELYDFLNNQLNQGRKLRSYPDQSLINPPDSEIYHWSKPID